MKTIATLMTPEEAHLLRIRLEAAGIAAWLENENTTQILGGFFSMLGGVRVVVADEDEAAAYELLVSDPGITDE